MIIQNFQQLRFIDLEGLRIDEHQLSTLPLPPPLLHLRVIAFTYWNAVKALDPWLLTCPNLMGLRFRRVFLKHEMSTLKVFSEGRITHLAFSSCLYWQITLPGWFTTAFANLRELECSTAIFASAWAYLPLTFDQLTLEVSSKHLGGVMEAITSYLAVATVKSLVLIVEKRNPWFQKNQYKLLQLCKVKSVIFEVDYLPYQYQSPLQHSLRNSWRKVANKVKELANEEASEVVRWESSPTAFDILMC
ncbi:hypothetical protein FRC19_009527 [Serendipita sp. 401]|nr:hypothetical protein FRC19_009527 [Serendipita sp. 401]